MNLADELLLRFVCSPHDPYARQRYAHVATLMVVIRLYIYIYLFVMCTAFQWIVVAEEISGALNL